MRFHGSLWLCCALALCAALGYTGALRRRALQAGLRGASLPRGAWDAGALTPEEAKARHSFWCPDFGALKLLQDPALFESVFPGYGDALGDAALWDRYFQEVFDQSVYSPLLPGSPGAPPLQIMTSWLGSFDIFRRYGADILIFGLSESFVSVNAGMLREELDAAGSQASKGARILQCGKGNIAPRSLRQSLEGLEGSPRKAKIAIWGYSIHYAHRPPYYAQIQSDLRATYVRWRQRDLVGGIDGRIPTPAWDDLLGPGLQERWDKHRGEPGAIPEAVAGDPEALEDFVRRMDDAPFSIGLEPKDCDFSRASAEADRTIAELMKVAQKVLIFIPPTADVNRRRAPACVLPELAAMLRSKAGPRVIIETPDWREFGLGYADYLRPAALPGTWNLDPDHVNPGGAAKVTRKIAGWVVEGLGTDAR